MRHASRLIRENRFFLLCLIGLICCYIPIYSRLNLYASFQSLKVTSVDTQCENICGRCVSEPYLSTSTGHHRFINFNHRGKHKILLMSGQRYGQTNNQLLSLRNALFEAHATNATIVIPNISFAHKVLKLFMTDKEIKEFSDAMGKEVIKKNTFNPTNHTLTEMSGKELFYLQRQDITTEMKTFITHHFFFQLFANGKSRACRSLKYFGLDGSNYHSNNEDEEVSTHMHPIPYTVIHSRWMLPTDPNCMKRLGTIADRTWDRYKIRLDRSVPCELPPEYIHFILQQNNMLNSTADQKHQESMIQLSSSPVYIISDGLNSSIVQRLLDDPLIGHRVQEVPRKVRSVVGDMTLGALSSVFIGTPTSTLSSNIGSARLAFGYDNRTNYLKALERRSGNESSDGGWEFMVSDSRTIFD